MKGLLVVAAVGAAALGLALFLSLGSSGPQAPFGAFSPQPGGSAALAKLPAPASLATSRRATAVALRDRSLRALLDRNDWRTGSVSRWSAGAAVAIWLRRPIRVDANLPYVAIPPDAPATGQCARPYLGGWLHLQAGNVTRVDALVDLRPGHVGVVEIDTNARRGYRSPVPGKQHPWCEESQSGT